jgi:hypothetical protein
MRSRRRQPAIWLYTAGAIILVVIAGGLWFGRGVLRDTYAQATKPSVPAAVPFKPLATTTTPVVPTKPVAEPTEEVIKPANSTSTVAFAKEVNLAVPFMLQAPKQNWVDPFEDACEEASLLMVDGYYKGHASTWNADDAVKAILDVVAYEDKTYGYNKDTTANDVAHTAIGYFGYPKAQVIDATDFNIKNMLNKGYPVIIPADGKALKNPNFKNGGPEYHMLVIKGYKSDGSWITNDPGTRNGPDYVYPHDRLLDAIHDFKHGDMEHGAKIMVVILPQ